MAPSSSLPRLPSSPLVLSTKATPLPLLICGVWCGIVNNASFCVLLGASQDIAKHFGLVDKVSLVSSSSTTGAILGVALNAKLFVGTFSELVRMMVLLMGCTAGYLLVVAAYAGMEGAEGFYMCCVGKLDWREQRDFTCVAWVS